MRRKVTKTTPLNRRWTRLPKALQFKVKAKSFFVRRKAHSGAIGTVVAARKIGSKVEVRVRYRSGKTTEDSINVFTKPRKTK